MICSSSEKSQNYLNSLEIQKRLSHAQNYNEWLFSQVADHVNGRVLEVGCAIGNFTKALLNRTFVCAIDVEDGYVALVRDTFKNYPNMEARQCDISSPDALEPEKGRFDSIVCFNVLEHIKDDDRALRNMRALLREGGHLCLIVPAFQSIYGSMDRTDNHYRRYSKPGLLKKVNGAGFKVIRLKYLNMPGFFGWWFNGKILKRDYIPFKQMLLYDRIIPVIRSLESVLKPPFGQSIVMIAAAGRIKNI